MVTGKYYSLNQMRIRKDMNFDKIVYAKHC